MPCCCENGRKPSDSFKCGECFNMYIVLTCIVICGSVYVCVCGFCNVRECVCVCVWVL